MKAKHINTDTGAQADDAETGVNYVEEARQRANAGAGVRLRLDFPLIEIKGEPLSATIIRERRGEL